MFKTLTDASKAAIFIALVLILAVAAALVINALGLASNEFAWGAVWSITPALATMIILLVVTREGYSQKGWQSLGLGRLVAAIGGAVLVSRMMLRGADEAHPDVNPPWRKPVTPITATAVSRQV